MAGLFLLAALARGELLGQDAAGRASEAAGGEAVEPGTNNETEWPFLTPPPEPPDGVWLVDEQGEYFLEKHPRIEGFYTWQDEEKTIVRLRNLPAVPVWDYDDEFFYFRVNRVTTVPTINRKKGPSEEELAAVAATYPAELPAEDRYRFAPFGRGLPESGQWRNGFAVADMNGDGHLDIVHPPARKSGGTPVIFLGDGQGAWRVWEEARFPSYPYDYGDAAVADLDGDGHLDLALAVHLRGLVVLRGDGKGGFELWSDGLPWAPVKGRTERHFLARALTVVDWDGDGRPDLAAISEGPTGTDQLESGVDPKRGKRVFLNEPQGWRVLMGPEGDPSMGDHVRTADLNGDGRMDLITDSRISGNRQILNFQTEDGSWEPVELEGLRPNGYVWAIETADLNRDGALDLVVSYHSRELGIDREGIDLFYGDGTGRGFRRVGLYATEQLRPARALAVGDLDGDGHLDVVGVDAAGEFLVFFGTADERFRRELSPELEPGPGHRYCAGYRAQIVDLDRDGRGELLAGLAGEPGSESVLAPGQRCNARGALRGFKLEPIGPGSSGP